MKKKFFVWTLVLGLLAAFGSSAGAISLHVNDAPAELAVSLHNDTSYVPIRETSALLAPGVSVSWENGQAVVRSAALTLTARPGNKYVEANGRMLFARDGVLLKNGKVLVPIRVLAKAMGASVEWDGARSTVLVTRGSGTITPGSAFYDSSAVYWLSRIINAESSGEPLEGKIAVGNVVLNRVASPDFPDTIYNVIFDKRWGGQFQPASNGTIHDMPNEESVLAAKLCLDGASVAGSSLYFLNPAKSTNFWSVKNRAYVSTIGLHAFYA